MLFLLIATILVWIGVSDDNYQTQFWAMMPPPIRERLRDSMPTTPGEETRSTTPPEPAAIEMQLTRPMRPEQQLVRYQPQVSAYGFPAHEFPNPPDRTHDLARAGRNYSHLRAQSMFQANPALDPHLRRITQRSADEMRAIQRERDRPGPRWLR